jgi:large subunit ribosomal protein L25
MTGKGGARKVRAAGQCPAVLYGRGVAPRPLQVDPKNLENLMTASGENTLIDLQITAAENKPAETTKVIIRDLQYPPLGDLPSHIDFYQVSLDRAVTMTVPLELVGSPPAVERKEGTLSQQLYEISIECLPGDIPPKIEIDISGLEVGQAIHVSDLVSLRGVTLIENPGVSIATVSAVKEVVEEEEIRRREDRRGRRSRVGHPAILRATEPPACPWNTFSSALEIRAPPTSGHATTPVSRLLKSWQ